MLSDAALTHRAILELALGAIEIVRTTTIQTLAPRATYCFGDAKKIDGLEPVALCRHLPPELATAWRVVEWVGFQPYRQRTAPAATRRGFWTVRLEPAVSNRLSCQATYRPVSQSPLLGRDSVGRGSTPPALSHQARQPCAHHHARLFLKPAFRRRHVLSTPRARPADCPHGRYRTEMRARRPPKRRTECR